MNEVTRILCALDQGDPHAAEQLLPLVYEELRRLATQRLAREAPGQTLQATALVHEAYLRLVDAEQAQHWNSRGHFFAAAAEAMRRIVVDNARRKQRRKHGGGRKRIDRVSPTFAASSGSSCTASVVRNCGRKRPDRSTTLPTAPMASGWQAWFKMD
jgi:RNA polymerase sigma factor (TIGR02999 family)